MKKRAVCLILSAAMMLSMCGCNVNITVNGNDGAGQEDMAESSDNAGAEEGQKTGSESDEGQTDANGNAEANDSADTNDTADTDADGSQAEAQDYSTGNPWVNSDILSNVEAYGDEDLKDNFAMAENAQWTKDNPIKEGETRNVYLDSFGDELNERLAGIATDDSDTDDHNAELVRTLYNEFLDWDNRDELGTQPLMPYLEEIENIKDMNDFVEYSGKKDLTFASIISPTVSSNPNDSSQNIIAVSAPAFYLRDAADYKDLDSMTDDVRTVYDGYKQNVKTVLSKCGYSDQNIDEIFEGSIKLEQMLAAYCYTNDEKALAATSATISGQVYTSDELEKYEWFKSVKKLLSDFDIDELPGVNLYDKMDYFENLDSILCEDNIELIKDYLLAHTASSAIVYLDKDSYYAAKDTENKLFGSTGYKKETQYAVDVVSSMLEWPLSKLYVDKYVTEEDKQNIIDIVKDVVAEYHEMLKNEDFLSDATKEEAINKLDNLGYNCMYPDDWSDYDYSDLELADNYFDSIAAINEFNIAKTYSEFYDPVKKDKWVSTPITQNAYYARARNTINIYPGLVGDVLYNSEMSKEEVYALIGVIIGHEISHAFDANGARYDADGNVKNWWTDEDEANFTELTDKMVKYYNGITAWDGLNCNGELVKTEACADMGGMAVILSLAAKDKDFDYKKFFETYAGLWAANVSPQFEIYQAKYDVHPLCYLRINVTVAQFDEFYEAFGIEEGDGMYIAPEDRVKIW